MDPNTYQLSSPKIMFKSYEESPRNFLPADMLFDLGMQQQHYNRSAQYNRTNFVFCSPRNQHTFTGSAFQMGVESPHGARHHAPHHPAPHKHSPHRMATPLSPVNGARGTPFQYNGYKMGSSPRLRAAPTASPKQFYGQPNRSGRVAGPPRGFRGTSGAPMLGDLLLASPRLNREPSDERLAFGGQMLPAVIENQQGSFPFNENIENFEPGSPAWRPSTKDNPITYPTTPNFKKWLKPSGGHHLGGHLMDKTPSPPKPSHSVSRTNAMNQSKTEQSSKLGPERYKSLRVTGNGKANSQSSYMRGPASFHTPGNSALASTSTNKAGGASKGEGFNQDSSFRQNPKHQEKKQSLYKTELCTNWCLTSNCTYGNKCHFAHGIDDLNPRTRLENFKTQPCCDPARDGSKRCLYGSRCNYCHPGEAIRRPVGKTYFDQQYYRELEKDFGDNRYPYGIYV